MDQRLSEFIRVREALIELVDQFPDDKVDEILFGEWSLKSVLAHLAGWDAYFVEILLLLEAGKEAPHWGSMEKFNQASVQERAAYSWIEVYDDFIAAGDQFILAYGDLEPGLGNARFWKGRAFTPCAMVDINIHHYEESHLPLIRRKLESLRDDSRTKCSSETGADGTNGF